MPIVESSFRPAWFARGGHAQTLWAPLCRRPVRINVRRERLELPDGDFVDLDWCHESGRGPLVVLLHGLQGSLRSPYVRGMMRALAGSGLRSVLMHFRGCSGEPNRLLRGYHSGDTADLAFLIDRLRDRYPDAPLAVVGYSLGANVLLKWLGETAEANPLAAAVGVCPPFELGACADHITRGFSRVYQSHLLRSLQRLVTQKARHALDAQFDLPIDITQVRLLRTFREFDHHVTAPIHGFDSAADYYTRTSCRQYLGGIAVPTLVLHARNDPFIPRHVVPDERDLSGSVRMELSDDGGHIGFVGGARPWSPNYWLEARVPRFLQSSINTGSPCPVPDHDPDYALAGGTASER